MLFDPVNVISAVQSTAQSADVPQNCNHGILTFPVKVTLFVNVVAQFTVVVPHNIVVPEKVLFPATV